MMGNGTKMRIINIRLMVPDDKFDEVDEAFSLALQEFQITEACSINWSEEKPTDDDAIEYANLLIACGIEEVDEPEMMELLDNILEKTK